MRFGIIANQMDSLVPPGLAAEDLMAHVANFDHAQLVRDMANNGFKLIEIGCDLSLFLPKTLGSEAIQELGEIKSELGLSYTVHLPLWSVEPSTPLDSVRVGSLRALVDAVNATKPLEPEMYVLHATGALAAEFYRMKIPELAKSYILRQFQSAAKESLQSLLKETNLPSRKVAIETIEFPFELTLELADDLDLSICLDTGHVLVGFSGPIDLNPALERCLPRLGEIHLHDGVWQGRDHNIGYGKDHQALGKGDLDIPRFLNRVHEVGFDGPIVFELTLDEAVESLAVIRDLLPDLV